MAATKDDPKRDHTNGVPCKTPGLCECPDMKRCKGCGYTKHDKAYWMDHYLCGVQPKERKNKRKAY